MPCKTDGAIEKTQQIGLFYTTDHRFILRMLQVQPDKYKFGLIQPGFANREMDQATVFKSALIVFGAIKFIGLEVIVKRV